MLKRSIKLGIIQSLRLALSKSPREISRFGGALFGLALYRIQKRDSFRACRNIQIAYGSAVSAAKARSIARQAFVNAGLNVADVVRLETKYPGELASLIDVEGLEFFEKAYQKGKGVIATNGHIGNFELLAAFCARHGFKTAVIGRELYDKRLDEILLGIRRANNVVNINTTEVRKFIRALRNGYAVGVLIDTDSQRVRSGYVESYGRLAYTPLGQTIIGLKLGASFAPLVCHRIGKRYLLKFFKEIHPGKFPNTSEGRLLAALDLTWRIRKLLDAEVDGDPTQWVWTHNRWNTRPDPKSESPPGLGLYKSCYNPGQKRKISPGACVARKIQR